MAELALIPPFKFLKHTHNRSLQMMLPSCMSNTEYREQYRRHGLQKGTYVILDNGMFERSHSLANEELLRLAKAYSVDEVVMPDVRGNWRKTAQQQRAFFHQWDAVQNPPKLMAVVQGGMEHIADIAEWAPVGKVVLGFPRRMTETGDRHWRINTMEAIARQYGKQFQFHMLGMSRAWPGELFAAVRQFGPMLRGMDTDAPYVYAAAGRRITLMTGPEFAAERPSDYFSMKRPAFDAELLQENIATLEGWIASVTMGT